MSTRKQRREVAAANRQSLILEWIALGKAQLKAGKTLEEALRIVAVEAGNRMDAEPVRSSEISRAFDELLVSMRESLKTLVKQNED